MKKLITLLFVLAALVLTSCSSGEINKGVKIDSTTVKTDSSTKVDTCKKIDTSVVKK